MNKISIEELEQKIEAGEEVIDTYFDPNSTRVRRSLDEHYLAKTRFKVILLEY
jgi:hypothetical protein